MRSRPCDRRDRAVAPGRGRQGPGGQRTVRRLGPRCRRLLPFDIGDRGGSGSGRRARLRGRSRTAPGFACQGLGRRRRGRAGGRRGVVRDARGRGRGDGPRGREPRAGAPRWRRDRRVGDAAGGAAAARGAGGGPGARPLPGRARLGRLARRGRRLAAVRCRRRAAGAGAGAYGAGRSSPAHGRPLHDDDGGSRAGRAHPLARGSTTGWIVCRCRARTPGHAPAGRGDRRGDSAPGAPVGRDLLRPRGARGIDFRPLERGDATARSAARVEREIRAPRSAGGRPRRSSVRLDEPTVPDRGRSDGRGCGERPAR